MSSAWWNDETDVEVDVSYTYSGETYDSHISQHSLCFPTSSARDELNTCPLPTTSATRTAPTIVHASPPAPPEPVSDPSQRRKDLPYIFRDGAVADDHPFVTEYLRALPPLIRYSPFVASTSATPQALTRWHVMNGGMAEPSQVAGLLGLQVKLHELEAEAVFSLAALKVVSEPKHEAHFAFWGRNVMKRTAEVINRIYFRRNPTLIRSDQCWLGTSETLPIIMSNQDVFVPKTSGTDRNLRNRKPPQAAKPSVGAAGTKRARTEPEGGEAEQRAVPKRTRVSAREAAASTPVLQTRSRARAEKEKSAAVTSSISPTPAPVPTPAPIASSSTTSPPIQPAIITREAKLEEMSALPSSATASTPTLEVDIDVEMDAPPPARPPPSAIAMLPPPVPTRRSTRQANRAAAATPAPAAASDARRSRSTSATKSGRASVETSGSSTAVSEIGTSEDGTVVAEAVPKSKKRKARDDDEQEEKPEPQPARKQRARAPARKRAKTVAATEPEPVVEEPQPEPELEKPAPKAKANTKSAPAKKSGSRKTRKR
ncbi:hypothetical protein A0H81_13475 [Grifola frondosa]|uniref:Uncharacterized protein n=1 Tax=Grifola frondosa TaxID=5627 RepID=A0A1C7LPA1_GRIFR|nr:hypothetical protein A0H81_13475 [Grifola frondosa]